MVRRKSDKVLSVGAEFPQKTRRLFHVYHSKIRKDALVELSRGVEVGARSSVGESLAVFQPQDDVLRVYLFSLENALRLANWGLFWFHFDVLGYVGLC